VTGEFRMPSLGADMDEGKLVEWLVEPGDRVARGDLVAVVETSKAAVEVEVWEEGVVAELCVAPGTTVPVGTVLARLEPAGSEAAAGALAGEEPGVAAPPAARGEGPLASARPPAAGPAAAPSAPSEPAPSARAAAAAPREAAPPRPASAVAPPPAAQAPPSGVTGSEAPAEVAPAAPPAATAPSTSEVEAPAGPGRVRASPYARRRARELGVDLAGVRGTGSHGAIRAQDVEAAAPPPSPAAAAEARREAMREGMARAMARSKREIPHYYLGTQVDLGATLEWLEARNAERPLAERILPAALLLKAVAAAAAEVPEVNGFYRDGRFEPSDAVHLGVGISVRGGGLVAPALIDAGTKPLDALMADLRDLVARARKGSLRGREMSAPTLTVTNLGDQGVRAVFGVIYPPQVALVGVGKVEDRPWVVDGAVVVRPVVDLSLAADHRASDGHRGGRYLAAVAKKLQRPESL